MKKSAPRPILPTRTCGRHSSPEILFLHGFLGSSSDWLQVVRELRAAWRCVLTDLPGHGRAHFPKQPKLYSLDGLAQAVLASVRQPVHLVGYSLGGRLALRLALLYPERFLSLTLISASPGLPTAAERAARRRSDDALAKDLETRGLNAFLSPWYAQALFGDLRRKPALLRRLLARRRKNDAAELARMLRGCSVGRQPSLWPQLKQLRLPVLLLAGAQDEKYVRVMQQMQRQIRGAQLGVVPGAAHAVVEEQPARVARALEKFWAGSTGASNHEDD
jgi:2-succinyl-6-hydroxy-2,4-cyclohexadiene-1-carboxylate synthase